MTRALQGLAALAFGALAGALAAISHGAFVPIGTAVAVAGSYAVVRLAGLRTNWRPAPVLAALAWVVVIARASIEGFSGELIIWDSTVSSFFLVLGSLAVVVAAVLPLPRR